MMELVYEKSDRQMRVNESDWKEMNKCDAAACQGGIVQYIPVVKVKTPIRL
jgi:hypothetical protein